MKKTITILLLLVALQPVLAQSKPGPHGGQVKETNSSYKAELLVEKGSFYVFLLDKDQQPVNNLGVSCSMNICFNNCDKTEHQLKPFSTDGFTTENVPVADFFSCTVTFKVQGKEITVKFYNENDKG